MLSSHFGGEVDPTFKRCENVKKTCLRVNKMHTIACTQTGSCRHRGPWASCCLRRCPVPFHLGPFLPVAKNKARPPGVTYALAPAPTLHFGPPAQGVRLPLCFHLPTKVRVLHSRPQQPPGPLNSLATPVRPSGDSRREGTPERSPNMPLARNQLSPRSGQKG